MGFGKWLADVFGRLLSNLLTGAIFLVVAFFGLKLFMRWMGV